MALSFVLPHARRYVPGSGGILNKPLPSPKTFSTLFFISVSLASVYQCAHASEPHNTDSISRHDHRQHNKWIPYKPNTKTPRFNPLNPNTDIPRNIVLSAPHKPNAYSDDRDYSGLSKPMMGDSHLLSAFIVDRLEGVSSRNEFSLTYDWQAWFGGDYNRLVVRAEGEVADSAFKAARNELLWGHALTAFWDSQIGLRYDSGMGIDRIWGAFGVQGYAPYWIYIEATAYIGEEGRTAFRLETEYDVLLTQKLILQPRIEVNFYSESDSSRLISSGLSNIEAGLRLRYEIKREFAPYIGIEWGNTFGSAADIIRTQGKKAEETRFVAGVHFWF